MLSLMMGENKTFLENVYPLGNIRTLGEFENEYDFKISQHL